MTYLSGKSKSRRLYTRYAVSGILLVLVIYYWVPLRAFVYPYVEPLVRGYSSTKGVVAFMPSFVSTYFVSHKTLAEKNRQLEISIERLENEIALRDAFIREQELTKEGYPSSPSVIVMYPVMEDKTKLYSTILLSKGYKDGIEEGGLVYVRGLQPVCTIIKVSDRTSLCELLSKGDRMTEAVTASGTAAFSISGMGGGNFIAEIPKVTNVSAGEDVYLRSDPSFKIGNIISIKEDDQTTSMRLYIRGMYNPVTSSVFYMNTKYAR